MASIINQGLSGVAQDMGYAKSVPTKKPALASVQETLDHAQKLSAMVNDLARDLIGPVPAKEAQSEEPYREPRFHALADRAKSISYDLHEAMREIERIREELA